MSCNGGNYYEPFKVPDEGGIYEAEKDGYHEVKAKYAVHVEDSGDERYLKQIFGIVIILAMIIA